MKREKSTNCVMHLFEYNKGTVAKHGSGKRKGHNGFCLAVLRINTMNHNNNGTNNNPRLSYFLIFASSIDNVTIPLMDISSNCVEQAATTNDISEAKETANGRTRTEFLPVENIEYKMKEHSSKQAIEANNRFPFLAFAAKNHRIEALAVDLSRAGDGKNSLP
jgi:hypothetical protein